MLEFLIDNIYVVFYFIFTLAVIISNDMPLDYESLLSTDLNRLSWMITQRFFLLITLGNVLHLPVIYI